MVTVSGRNTWAAGLISALITLAYIRIVLKVSQTGSDNSIIEHAKNKFPVLGNALGFILVAYFVFVAFVTLRDFEIVMNLFMQRTPTVVFGLVLMLLGSYAIKQGLEVLARVALLLLLPSLILIAFVIIANMLFIDFHPALIPVESWKRAAYGVVHQSANFGELFVLIMILPLAEKSRGTFSAIALPVLFTGLLITALIFNLYANFDQFTIRITYKFYELYRNIGRYDSAFIFLWVATFFIKVPVFLYAAVKGLGDTLALKSHGPLVLPMALIITFLSLTSFSGFTDYTQFFITSYPYARLSVEAGVPLLLLAWPGLGSPGAKVKG